MQRRKRQRTATTRGLNPVVGTRPNECWRLDFVSDASVSGRRIRALTMLDTCMREALNIEVATSLPGARVVHVLDLLIAERRVPRRSRSTTGQN